MGNFTETVQQFRNHAYYISNFLFQRTDFFEKIKNIFKKVEQKKSK